jgi:leader peptidase (prepilin peptidase) / N-methyltransferase
MQRLPTVTHRLHVRITCSFYWRPVGAAVAGHWGWRLADRLPGETVWPQCIYCQRPSRWFELLPLLGWLLRRDRFSFACPCGQRYRLWVQPVTEMVGLLLGLFAGFMLDGTWLMVWVALCLGLMPAIALIDVFFGVIPDQLNIALGALGLAWLFSEGGELTVGLTIAGIMLIIGLALAVGYSKLRKKDMMGFGDVKFFAAAGLWLQPEVLPWFLVASGVIGAVGGIIWQRAGGGEQSPFAPALVLAFTGCLIYQVITAGYL